MSFRTDLDAVILSCLEEGPMHGYAIVKALSRKSNGMVRLGEGQLYPALHKLEVEGLVESSWSEQLGRPSKRVYSITIEGTKELDGHRRQWSQFRDNVDLLMRPA